MNGLKYKFKKCISLILPIFLLGSISEEPFFTKQVNAAEIGMVGALPGSVTLWEIFQTIWAGAGIIIANDEIQTAAASNFGSSAYTLAEMQEMGFIPIGVDGNNALDWDWSGLEDELRNSDSEDAKVIRGIFNQSGGAGSGGNDEDPDEDPWYKKAVNWVKGVVKEGKVNLQNSISGENGTATMALSAMADMIGNAVTPYVDMGAPLDFNISINPDTILFLNCAIHSANPYEIASKFDYNGTNDYRIFYSYNRRVYSGRNEEMLNIAFAALNNLNKIISYSYTYTNGTSPTSGSVTVNSNKYSTLLHFTPWSTSISLGCKNGVQLQDNLNGTQVKNIATQWTNGTYESIIVDPVSPDVITPAGNAIANDGMYVPTPYMEPGTHLEIIPQPQINEFVTYIIENEPDIVPAGNAWIDTVNPYVSSDPTPAPTTRPQPTVKPNVSPIPDGEPGSEDNPIFTADPDPMPDIEDGFGTTFDLMDYFPFCIPSDLVAAFKVFEVSDDYRQAPYIDWNLKIDRFGIDEHIILDFSTFDSAAALFRILIFISFCISLIVLTKTLIWS